MIKLFAIIVLLLTLTNVQATPATPAPPPPPLATSDDNGLAPTDEAGAPETEITIVEKAGERMEEYRVSGRLYMVKVTPAVGPSYFLIDRDGDGVLETRMDGLRPDFLVPQWVLFHW